MSILVSEEDNCYCCSSSSHKFSKRFI